MNKDDTKKAIIGFTEFMKGITGNKDLKIPEDIVKEYGIEQDDTSNNLCNSCTNIGCEFQSGIVRTKCAFYMPPHIEPDNCRNYVVQPTYEARLKADIVTILDKIRAEINGKYRVILKGTPKDDWSVRWNDCLDEVLQIIDKYKAEIETQEKE